MNTEETHITEPVSASENRTNWPDLISKTFLLILVVYVFMLIIELMVRGFSLIGSGLVQEIIGITSNPFIGLFIGLLATALIQSSSTVTAALVAMVASGTITLENAVPIVMGANVGTTLTSTMISLVYITNDNKEYKRAVITGASHNMFNILSVIVMFPLEYYFGFLTKMSRQAAQWIPLSENDFSSPETTRGFSFIRPVVDLLADLLGKHPYLILVVAVIALLLAIRSFTFILKKYLYGAAQRQIDKVIFGSPSLSLFWGFFITGFIHSSTTTTSMVVPLAATRKITIKKAFDFILGANIGTTITAVMAALYKSEAAVTIAIVHVLFNLIGVLIAFPFPAIKKVPLDMARMLGNACVENRITGFIYLVSTFFLIPFVLISVNNQRLEKQTLVYAVSSPGAVSQYMTIVDEFDDNTDKGIQHIFIHAEEQGNTKYDLPQKTVEYSYQQNLYSIDGDHYLLSTPGSCARGKEEICLEKIITRMKLGKDYYSPVYVFSSLQKDSTRNRTYFYPLKRLVLRKETQSKDGLILKKLELFKMKQ